MEKILKGKKVYAFGDSIVYGHTHPEYAFMRQIADENGMYLGLYAINGATISKSENWIYDQVMNASEEKPDFIIFDGYTNDAYKPILEKIGSISKSEIENKNEMDKDSFCGGFIKIVSAMKNKWPEVPIVYVTIHKSNAREWNIQTLLREKSIEICKLFDVDIIDMFMISELDTRKPGVSEQYIIDGAGSHPNDACCKKYYVPVVKEELIKILNRNHM